MEQQMLMGKSAPMMENPTLNLRGENLEYYKNIEYLKEMTRQANALLDRSNAKYENILDDQKLGYKVRARSVSDSSKSVSPELEGRCKKCGLAHGAANFCIVEKIMVNEKEIEVNKRRSKVSRGVWSCRSNLSVDSKKLLHHTESAEETIVLKKQHNVFQNVSMLDKMTPSEVLDSYEALCFRYGPESGRKFLLATTLQNPPEGKIEPWTTPRESLPPKRPELVEKPTLPDVTGECESLAPQPDNPLCPEVSQDILKKMETLLQVFPPCQTQPLDRKKNWKEVFDNQQPKHGEPSTKDDAWSPDHLVTVFDSSEFDHCQCAVQTCECRSTKICTTPKIEKRCNIINATDHEEEYNNNYLLTMRKKIWGRRQVKRKGTQFQQRDNIDQAVVAQSKSEEYLARCRAEHRKALKSCLTKNVTGYDEQEFDNMVKMLADMTVATEPIKPRQLDHWNERYKEQHKAEERDEIDSLSSDIHTDEESSLLSHQTEVDNKFGRIKPSRIPFAEDVYDLIDNIYEKITRKFEASIRKNSFNPSRLSFRPKYEYLHSKFNILKYRNPLFKEIMHQTTFPYYTKTLTPFRIRVRKKLKRLEALERRLQQAERRRNMARGLQLGKRYRRVSTHQKYSPESGYAGFRLHERQMLGSPNRFETFNLAGNGAGRPITVKRIHHDFRLMSKMFEDAANTEREDLIDQGMQQRLREFQRKLYNRELPKPPETLSDTADETDYSYTHIKSTKEEMLKLQKAKPSFDQSHVTFTKSDENMPHQQRSRHRNYDKCKTSNSEEKLRNLVPKRNEKERGMKPQKSTSNTDVKEKIGSRKITQTKGSSSKKTHQVSSSVKSLTNLLPPLKSHDHKPPPSEAYFDVNNLYGEDEIFLASYRSKIPVLESKEKTASGKRHSPLTKLPQLETPVKTHQKSSNRKITYESLPSIKQRESVENLRPGHLQKPSGRALTRRMSVMDVNIDRKLPLLVDKARFGRNASDESWPKTRRKPVARSRIEIPSVPKQSGFKAWR